MDSKSGGRAARHKNVRKGGKTARNYEDEEWRTVYIGFVERGTSSEDLAKVFKVQSAKSDLSSPSSFHF